MNTLKIYVRQDKYNNKYREKKGKIASNLSAT